MLHLHVGGGRVHSQGHVCRERPGGGGPNEKRLVRFFDQGHEHEHRWILHVSVPLRYLVGGEGRPAPGTVGQDLVPPIEKPLLMDLLQPPPNGLDVVVRVGDVGLRKIDPKPHAPDHVLPGFDVLMHRSLAFFYKLLQSVALDLGLGLDAEFPFHLELHRQPMAVPTRLAGHEVPAHGLVAREQVLVNAWEQVSEVGAAVRCGWSLVEHKLGAALSTLKGAFKDAPFLPKRQYRLLTTARIAL